MAKISSEEQAYRDAVRTATERWGRGWDHLSDAQQRAAVAERMFFVIAAQDESVPGATIVRIVQHAQSRMADDFPGA